jgi:hypothetical protein
MPLKAAIRNRDKGGMHCIVVKEAEAEAEVEAMVMAAIAALGGGGRWISALPTQ